MWTPDPSDIITAAQHAAEAHAAQFVNLEPDQFWFMVRLSGRETALNAWVAAMNDPESASYDPVAWAGISSKLEHAKYFERNHPFIEAATAALDITAQELDALWLYALQPE